jgi:hypothetical protein
MDAATLVRVISGLLAICLVVAVPYVLFQQFQHVKSKDNLSAKPMPSMLPALCKSCGKYSERTPARGLLSSVRCGQDLHE